MKRQTDVDYAALFDQAEVLPDEKEVEAARIAELGKIADNATLFTETLKRKLHVGILDVIDELLNVALHSKHTAPKVTACRTVLALAKECGVLDLDPVRNFLNAVNNDANQIGTLDSPNPIGSLGGIGGDGDMRRED